MTCAAPTLYGGGKLRKVCGCVLGRFGCFWQQGVVLDLLQGSAPLLANFKRRTRLCDARQSLAVQHLAALKATTSSQSCDDHGCPYVKGVWLHN